MQYSILTYSKKIFKAYSLSVNIFERKKRQKYNP